MSRFGRCLSGLFVTAQQEGDLDLVGSDLGIIVSAGGSIRVMDASGWRTDSLLAESGAEVVYRIQRTARSTFLEACSTAGGRVVHAARSTASPAADRRRDLPECDTPLRLLRGQFESAGAELVPLDPQCGAGTVVPYDLALDHELDRTPVLQWEGPVNRYLHAGADGEASIVGEPDATPADVNQPSRPTLCRAGKRAKSKIEAGAIPPVGPPIAVDHVLSRRRISRLL